MESPLLQMNRTALVEGERELAFRRRFLYFCGGLPLFEMIAIVCLLSVADSLPVDVVTVSYWLVCALSLNAFVLLNGWPAMRKRGTRQSHLMILILMTMTGLLASGTTYWYLFTLSQRQGRIESLCDLSQTSLEGAVSMSCHAQWLTLTLVMFSFLSALSAANLAMLAFGTRILTHGHRRKVAMVMIGAEDRNEFKLW